MDDVCKKMISGAERSSLRPENKTFRFVWNENQIANLAIQIFSSEQYISPSK
jgi:hypothetical protein